MQPKAGRAALAEARTKLAPLFDTVNAGEASRTYRAMPVAPTGANGIEALREHLSVLEKSYDSGLVTRRRTMFVFAGVSAIVAAALTTQTPDMASNMHTLLGLNPTITLTVGFLIAIVCAFLTVVLSKPSVENAINLANGTTQLAVAAITAADFADMVTVTNPSPTVALRLDEAREDAVGSHKRYNSLTADFLNSRYRSLLIETADLSAGLDPRTRADRWATAWNLWCEVDEAWTDLVCNPHAVLTHPELLDLDQPRTAAFFTAYVECREAMTTRSGAMVPADLPRLLNLVETTHDAWVAARDHTAARTMWATARGTNHQRATMSERARAAGTASLLFASITKRWIVPPGRCLLCPSTWRSAA